MPDLLDVLVIGKGLMGTAATKYLAQAGLAVAVIGPDEPGAEYDQAEVFASHYDQGRITRALDQNETWARLAQRAIGNYREIEEQSGIPFYFPVGGLYASPMEQADGYAAAAPKVGDALNAPYQRLTAKELASTFPFFTFPPDHAFVYEPSPAGYINPRDLVRAQVAVAVRHGARVYSETVNRVVARPGGVDVSDAKGNLYRAKKVLVAAGAFSNAPQLLSGRVAMRAKSTTILLGRVNRDDAGRLGQMPTLIYDVADPVVSNIYLLPPIQYPDGQTYLKMGCNTAADYLMDDIGEIRRWFVSGASDQALADMRRALQTLMPGIAVDEWYTRRCVTARTPSELPYIDQVADGLYLCAGGNGSAAKSSDSLGFLAAQLLMDEAWPAAFPRSLFRATLL